MSAEVLYIPAMDRAPAPVDIRAWLPGVPGIREVLHATFREHAYPPHTHDAWTLFIVDAGAIRYDLDQRARGAVPSMVSILPPHVVHDGRPATSDGFRKRVLYLEPETIGEERIGASVDRPMLRDPALHERLDTLHARLEAPDDRLETETRLAFVLERLRIALGGRPDQRAPDHHTAADDAERLRAWLDARLFEPVTMADAATALDATPTRLARAFSDTLGIAPHRYVLGRRLDAARGRLLDGQPIADVAAEVGFVDQAHLTRRFRDFVGTTPGRFAEHRRA
jgi:AraC-like DNA-binding protein